MATTTTTTTSAERRSGGAMLVVFVVWFLLILGALGSQEAQQHFPIAAEAGKVIELNESTFDSAVSQYGSLLVNFYAPWCGFSQRLVPELNIAAQMLAARNEGIMIAQIDASSYRELAAKYRIGGYPTLKLFMHGNPIDYDGPKRAGLLVRFLRKFFAPEVSILESDSAIRTFVEKARKEFPVFIGFGLNESVLAEFARKYKKDAWFSIAKGFSEELMVEYNFDKVPAFVLIHPRYKDKNVFYGPFEGKFLEDFIQRSKLPLIVPINSRTIWSLNKDVREIVVTFVKDVTDQNSLKLVGILTAAASTNRDFVFGYVGVKQWREFAHIFDVSKRSKLPKMLVWNRTEEYHLVVGSESLDDGEDQGSQISRFLEGYREGRSVKIRINNPSFMGYLDSLTGHRRLYIIAFVVSIIILFQSFGRQEGDAPRTKQISTDANNDTNRSISEDQNTNQGYQPGDKEE